MGEEGYSGVLVSDLRSAWRSSAPFSLQRAQAGGGGAGDLVKISNCSQSAEIDWKGAVLCAGFRSGVRSSQLGFVLA